MKQDYMLRLRKIIAKDSMRLTVSHCIDSSIFDTMWFIIFDTKSFDGEDNYESILMLGSLKKCLVPSVFPFWDASGAKQ